MGTTATGLPYMEDNEPLSDVALKIKGLAEGVDDRPRGRKSNPAAQSIANGTGNATIGLTTLEYADGLGTAGNGFTIQKTGLYLVTLQITYPANAAGDRSVKLYKNAGLILDTHAVWAAANGQPDTHVHTVPVRLAANDVVDMRTFQTSGVALALGNPTALSLVLLTGTA